MRNLNFLFSNSVQGESDLTRYYPRDAFEMPLTYPRHLFHKMLILSMLLMIIGVGSTWGAVPKLSDLNFGDPDFTEDFEDVTAVSKSNTGSAQTITNLGWTNCAFTHAYLGKNNNGTQTIAVKAAASPMTSKYFELTTTSNIAGVSFSRTFTTKGAFSFKIAKGSVTNVGLHTAVANATVSHASASVYLNFTASAIKISSGSGWVNALTSLPSTDILEITVVYNNTNTNTSYGDGITLNAKRAHIYVNGTAIPNGSVAKDFTIPGTSIATFRVHYNAAGTGKVDDIKIYDALPTAAPSCEDLGSINGSINMTSSTDGTVTVKDWGEVSNASSYTVRMYKLTAPSTWTIVSGSAASGDSGTQGTRTGITNRSTGVTYSGLEYGETYKFTVQAIGNGSSYCDGDETAVTSINGNSLTDNKFLNKYYFRIDDGTQSDTGWENHYLASINASHVGTVNVTLTQDVDYYQYKLTLGGVIWWGNTGKMTSANHSEWTFTTGASNCKLQTSLGGTYTFSATVTTPSVTVTYPTANQASGKKIWFDKSVITGWTDADASQLYWRIGKPSHTTVNSDETANYFSLVPGTDRFYVYETKGYDGFEAWHIANNTAWSGSSDNNPDYDNHGIYTHYHNQSSTDVTRATVYQKYVVGNDGVTLVPTTKKNTDWYCDFWNVDKTDGMLTHNVAVGTAAHGTVVATYTNTSGTTGQTVAEGANADLAHRCIVTITATADPGYSCTSLTVNGDAFTSGNTHILTADAAIAATFTAQTSTVTLDNNDVTSGIQQTVTATYDAAMPLVTTAAGTPAVAALSRTGYTFTGWWDATSGGTQYYSYSGNPAVIASAHTWDKTGAQTLKAQWSINSYTLTWNLDGKGKITTAGTAAPENATGTPHDDIEYNTAISVPVAGNANGYTFTGWSPEPASNMPAENTTYTAQWSANQYTVTLNNHGATTAGTTSVTATFDAAMPAITPPEKTGYRFDGYYTAASGGTKYYNANGTSATVMKLYGASPTLHAHWVAQLTFSVNGVIDDELTRDDNTAMPSTAAAPAACGDCWAFMGWSTDPDEDGAPAYAGGATHEFGEPTTLYAVYGKAEYQWVKDLSDLVNNEYYILTMLDDEDNERALANSVTNTKYATATDISSNLKENSSGYFIYNPDPSIVWKFTGTTSSGRLYNESASKYLDLSSTSNAVLQASTSDNLNFTKFNSTLFNIASTSQTSHYLYMYTNPFWGVDNDHDGYSSCYIYKRQSAEFATEPSCETYDIVWKVNGTPLSSGSQTEETNACAGIETLPDDPDDDALDCATKFVGWSEQELVGVGHDAPADLFTSVGDAPAIDEDKTFHAVFATTIGTPIAAIEDTEFSSSDESGSYCKATFSFKAADEYLQKQSIWTSSNMTNVKVRIRVYHVSNNTSDVLRVSLINSSGVEVVGADLTTNNTGSDITSAGGYSSYVELTPTTAVTGYKVSMKTKNSFGTGINKIEREVVASGFKDYVTMCCNHIVTLSDGSPANGTVTFDPVGSVETCTAAQEVSMTITPNPGYYLSAWTSSGVAPSSVEPAVITNTANAQTTTVTFAKETTEGTYTAGATFSAKALEGWTWMYKKDADAADDAVDPYAIPDVVELYKDQYARFIITGYTPVDVIADKQGYVYNNNDSDPKEPQYDRDLLAYVSKNGSAPWQYFQLRGKAPTESTTITFKAVGDASITKTITIRVKALPLAHFVDNVHNESFADVVATVTTGVVTLTKQTPTHADFTGSALNTCEETHVYLIGWIDKDWADEHPNATHSEIIGAGEGVFYAPNADIDLVAKNGKTYLAVWSKIE